MKTPGTDDALVLLGLQLGEEWVREIRVSLEFGYREDDEAVAQTDAAYERVYDLVERIEAARAETFLGVCVKALAQCWCEASSLSADLESTDYDNTSERLSAAVRRDLLKVRFHSAREIIQ